jgi:hypothetical protein
MSRQPMRHTQPKTHSGDPKHEGKGGSRRGYRSSNEIEDMEIFDNEPGKRPSDDGRHDAKSIDENRYRERK